MNTQQVANAVGIRHTQVSRYARRLGITPVHAGGLWRGKGRTSEWPADTADRILTERAKRRAKTDPLSDGVVAEGDSLVILKGRTRLAIVGPELRARLMEVLFGKP